MKNKGELIIIEGVDGSGKTTLAKELSEIFGGLYMKEPLERYKKMLSTTYDPVEQLMLMWASRRKVFELIKENLKKSDYIFLDRSFVSTMIYQERAIKKLFGNFKEFLEKDKIIRYNIEPTLIIILEIKNISVIKERFKKENKAINVFEDERMLRKNIIKYQRIIKILRAIYGNKLLVINAEKDLKQVLDEILSCLSC